LCVTTNLVQVKKFSLTSHALLDTVLLGFVSGVLALNRKHFTQFKWDNLIADRGKAIRLLLPLAYLLYYVLFRYLFYKWVGVEKYSILAFYGLNALIAYLIFGYTRGLLLNKNFNEKASEKYKKNKLSLPLQEDYYNRIKSIVQEKALYLNPELSIKDLSQEVGIPAPYVSQVLNTFHEKGYYGFVNEYRIQKVIALLEIAHPDQKVNISDIAMESGFNSMTTFYKFFKEHVGTTPKEFLKRDFAM
jgi:AraC-like DNA-binding protein